MQHNLQRSLPDAVITSLERVHNPYSSLGFNQYCASRRGAVQELWHASSAIDDICSSKLGFDLSYAYKTSIGHVLKDMIGLGGHVYGYGVYFAAEALYTHWWNTRVWNSSKQSGGKSEHKLILARVFTGRSKDYGAKWAPHLRSAPPGFDSVCGSESRQRVFPVMWSALRGDRMAKTLLKDGDVYGKQFVAYDFYQAYPAYVVTYSCPDGFQRTQKLLTTRRRYNVAG